MKNIKFIILSILFLTILGACENVDFGDLNKNENGPNSTDPAVILAGAMKNYSTLTGREYLNRPTLYVQYQTQTVYTDEMRYNEVQSYWGQYYVNELSELQEVIDFLSDEENQTASVLSRGSIGNQMGVAKIFKSVIFKRVTDTWGDIPYSQALNPDILLPEYDSQKEIYESIINEVKQGRDMLNSSELGPTGDIVYNGDVDKWIKFANSFLLQASLQLSKKFPGASEYAATEFNSALSHSGGLIETVADEAWFTYYDVTAQNNPWVSNRAADYFLSKEFTDALHGYDSSSLNPTSNTTEDYRLAVYSTDYGADGMPYGYKSTQDGNSQMNSEFFWSITAKLPILTASYTFLNRADAANIGWTGEDVDAMLKDGIMKSYESLDAISGLGISEAAGDYADARVSDAGSFSYDQVIAEEKWVSLFPSGFDAWSEWRRTGYPELQPATDYLNDGSIPRRYLYPSEEFGLNGTNYAVGVSALSPAEDSNTSKVWWDQD